MNNDIEKLYSKGQHESPSTSLDNLILNQARQSCEDNNKRTKRWLYSASTAAVFVFAFGMIFNLQNQNQDMQVTPSRPLPKQEIEIQFESDIAIKEDIQLNARNRSKDLSTIEPNKTFTIGTIKKQENISVNLEDAINDYYLEEAESIEALSVDFEKSSPSVVAPESMSQPDNTSSLKVTKPPEKKLKRVAKAKGRISNETLLLNTDIEKLQNLIDNKQFDSAQKLLKKLKKTYSDYNFSNFDKLLASSQ